MAKKTIKLCPREKILKAGAAVFAQKGYSGVGVREIAKKAGVNIAMISYYFGGKAGILKGIFEEHYNNINKLLDELKDISLPPEEKFRLYIKMLVTYFTQNRSTSKVAIFEIPFEIKDITKLKVEMITKSMKKMKETINLNLDVKIKDKHTITGPAFISMLFSHFLFEPVIKFAF